MKKLLLLATLSLCASEKKNYHLKVPPKITINKAHMPLPKTPNNSPMLKKSRVTIKLTDGTIITSEQVQKTSNSSNT